MTFDGHVSVQEGVFAWTVTVKEQEPPPVEDEQLTVVVPTGKLDPDAGVHVTVPHEPLVVGAAKVTTSEPLPSESVTRILAGHVRVHVLPVLPSQPAMRASSHHNALPLRMQLSD